MTKQEFYNRIAHVVGRELSTLETNLLDISCTHEDMESLQRGIEGGWIKSIKGKVPEFIALEDAKERMSEGLYGYWLYDRRTKTWVINLSKGNHESLMGLLYGIFNDAKGSSFCESSINAEKYIDEHYGFFVSGSMNMYIPVKSDTYTLSAEEMIFEQAKGKLKWRGIS